MSDDKIKDLMRQAPLSFVGTVEHLGGATLTDIPVDERTAVVRVEHVLHAPDAFAGLAGQRVTVQLSADVDPPAVGEAAAFFATGFAFGESLAVTEVGRLPVEDVEPRAAAAAEAGKTAAFADLHAELAAESLRAHAGAAEAVVVGKVTALAKAGEHGGSEHDPDWWRATVNVEHVESGNVPAGELAVLFANSDDVRWHKTPTLRAGDQGVFLLHATEGARQEFAPFEVVHPEDFQPLQSLETLRGNGG